ncbi:hypothetical protein TIFTF001_001766 [Ficus carica]|uniref:Uncharacterized protein n=1 Tax=Ficus carica TaxID=3494 RepID=A0AA87Z0T1_FICCA|nr:hypothetical protein TIFTF001_001766 [Ficus carica]
MPADIATTVEDLSYDNNDAGSRSSSIFDTRAVIFSDSGDSLRGYNGIGFLLPSPTERGLRR